MDVPQGQSIIDSELSPGHRELLADYLTSLDGLIEASQKAAEAGRQMIARAEVAELEELYRK